MQIDDFYVEIVLAVNVKGDCNKKLYFPQTYSTNWVTSYAVNNNK